MSLRLGGEYQPNQAYFHALGDRFQAEKVPLAILAADLSEKPRFGDPATPARKSVRILILDKKKYSLSRP